MPLFPSPLPTPQYLGDPVGMTGSGTPTAGSAFAIPVLLYVAVTVTQMRTAFSLTPTGSVDMGIYDSTGTNGLPNNLLGHTGANSAATGLFTKSLTANLPLSPGLYWLAYLDTVADTVSDRGTLASGLWGGVHTSATNLTVLANPFGALANTTFNVGIMALLSGGFS